MPRLIMHMHYYRPHPLCKDFDVREFSRELNMDDVIAERIEHGFTDNSTGEIIRSAQFMNKQFVKLGINKRIKWRLDYTQPKSKREVKYLVTKVRDTHDALSEVELTLLNNLLRKVREHREHTGRTPLNGVVIRDNDPAYQQVLDLLNLEQ